MAKVSMYQQLLSKSQVEKNQEEMQAQVESAELQLQADLLATRKSLAKSKRELDELKSSPNFNPSLIISKKKEVEGFEEGVKELEALRKELF